MEVKKRYAHFDTELPPVLVIEPTPKGWRGLTTDGVVLNVAAAADAQVIEIPYGGRVTVARNGENIGYRAVPERASPGMIDRYLRCFEIARKGMMRGHLENALLAIDTAISFVPTLAAQYNRGMILLEMGNWREGFAEYMRAMEYPGSTFTRPQYRACIEYGLTRWRGEDLRGKRLLLIHDHGLGDSIMMLRYVPMLKAMGADVLIWSPPELERLAMQCAPVVREIVGAHYFCPLLFLLSVLGQNPDSAPLHPTTKYLDVEPELMPKWRQWLGQNPGRTAGVAWTPSVVSENDYPRAIELTYLRTAEALAGVRLVSVQQRNGTADADTMSVLNAPFDDLADCAAAMMCCNQIVTIDTAAVHLAGAIGHSDIKLLLSHWASWRWLAPLYPNLTICRQDAPGDWDSAVAKL